MATRLERRAVDPSFHLRLRGAIGLIIVVATTLALIAAILEWLIDPEEFDTFGVALWWSVTTVTTVGYGDYVPVSTAGRVVASCLMLVGLALIPLITSVVVSILVSQRTRETREQEMSNLEQILGRLDSVDQRLADLEQR
jgi:voltage-gated potassium channel